MTIYTPPIPDVVVDNRLGYVWVNGILLTDLWAQVLDPLVLWRTAEWRAAQDLVPNVAGVVDYPWIPTGSQRDLTLVVNGYAKWDGSTPANPFDGLEENLDYINEQVVNLAALQSVAIQKPSGATRTGWGKVSQFEETSQGGPIVVGKLKIFLPDGQLA